MARHIALLRGINVGGRNKVPMAKLRDVCAGLGWRDVATYIQSGNIVFDADAPDEAALERAIESQFGLSVPCVVRSASEWRRLTAANPFPRESEAEPNRVLVAISKEPPCKGAAAAIEAKGASGERVREAGGALWFHYPEGAGQSKITPAMIDRAGGSPATARNWRTMLTLGDMAG